MPRIDGRANDQLRKINIQRNYIKYAEGSCLIEMGNTKVISTATVDKNVPLFLKNSGTGWVTAEYGMLPRSTQARIIRNRISGRNMEIQRLVGRALRSVVNFKNLGERTIWIDSDVIQADGGTRIASIIGGYISLVDAICKLYQQGIISQICITSFLGAISAGIHNGSYILDLTYEEDSSVKVDMNIVMKASGEFIEIQGAAEKGCFSHDDLNNLISLGKKGVGEIVDLERNILKDVPFSL